MSSLPLYWKIFLIWSKFKVNLISMRLEILNKLIYQIHFWLNCTKIIALQKWMVFSKQVGRTGCVPACGGNTNSRNVSCWKPSLQWHKSPWEGALHKWLTRTPLTPCIWHYINELCSYVNVLIFTILRAIYSLISPLKQSTITMIRTEINLTNCLLYPG